MTPRRPSRVSGEAAACLDALSASGLGRHISLGGAFGLAHYLDYRGTHDVDAWWQASATSDLRSRIIETLERALAPFGEIHTRRWGDVTSIELSSGRARAGFSFQIADRSVQLAASSESAWPGIALDAFEDLVASKMAALLQRGAPRDLLDVYTICDKRLIEAAECWRLWIRRERAAGQDADRARARLAIQTHLERLDQVRPLQSIADAAERAAAERLRSWYAREFILALRD